jgi:deazaflavin-dependent oxidoreductase (nitroreductase family)
VLDDALRAAPECGLTTTGRRSGEAREIAIWFAAAGDRLYLLAGGREQAHWVRNLRADPAVRVRIAGRSFDGLARVVEGQADDPLARAAIAAKYGTTGLRHWLRESLPVAIDLVGERDAG